MNKGDIDMMSNYPPGVRESDIPGCRPIDDAWIAYCERKDISDTIEVIEEALDRSLLDDEIPDWEELYHKHPEVEKAVDRHFEAWMEQPEGF